MAGHHSFFFFFFFDVRLSDVSVKKQTTSVTATFYFVQHTHTLKLGDDDPG